MKRIASIQDISCLGRCSLTVALPVISAMAVECAIVPTAVLSTHTMFPGFISRDLSDQLLPIARHWKSQNVTLDAICTGYLASPLQTEEVCRFFDLLAGPDTLLFVDPAMADGGRLYAGFGPDFPGYMRRVVARAHVAVPNVTEACLLTGTPYRETEDLSWWRDLLRRVAETVFIPFTVGGGIRTVEDFRALLREGADKISINSSAINTPRLISDAADKFGSQCVVVAIDAKRRETGGWDVYINGGRINMGIDAVDWAVEAERRGAGEILLTSMDCDGTKAGFDLALTRAVARAVPIPVIASGGVGTLEHFAEGVIEGEADAVLAASVFHFGTFSIREVKEYMASQGIPVRLDF